MKNKGSIGLLQMNIKFVGQLSVQILSNIKIQLVDLEMKCMDR